MFGSRKTDQRYMSIKNRMHSVELSQCAIDAAVQDAISEGYVTKQTADGEILYDKEQYHRMAGAMRCIIQDNFDYLKRLFSYEGIYFPVLEQIIIKRHNGCTISTFFDLKYLFIGHLLRGLPTNELFDKDQH